MKRILFVCLGNICRSPTAEAVLRDLAARRGIALEIASAGTGDWHAGEGADPRTVRHAQARGYDLSAHRARQVKPSDFGHFDLVLAMDRSNLANLSRLCPPAHAHKLGLFLAHAPGAGIDEVPDPWSGGPEGFERVLDLCEAAAEGLLAGLEREAA